MEFNVDLCYGMLIKETLYDDPDFSEIIRDSVISGDVLEPFIEEVGVVYPARKDGDVYTAKTPSGYSMLMYTQEYDEKINQYYEAKNAVERSFPVTIITWGQPTVEYSILCIRDSVRSVPEPGYYGQYLDIERQENWNDILVQWAEKLGFKVHEKIGWYIGGIII